jgi:hypothetical protein
MKKSIFLTVIYIISALVSHAQFSQEKIVELTGKSKNRGYLGNVVVDDTKQQFDMVFVTKDNNRKVEYEVYQFDYDFNLLNNFKEAERKMKSKSKNKTYRGKDYEEIQGVTAEANMTGKLVLKKMLYIYSWNWWRGSYEIETKLLDKEKPKEISGDGEDKKRKLYYTTHRDISDKGELMVCALVNKGVMDMVKEADREYLIMHIDKDLNTIKKTPLKFSNPQSLLFSRELEETNEWILVFAPFSGQGYKKIADPSPTNLTFIKIDASGNISERFNFQTKCNEWAIYDMFQNGNELYLYGGGNIDNPEKNYTKSPFCITSDAMPGVGDAEVRANTLEGIKYGYLQVVKIANGKAEFVSATSIEDINAKGIKPASQKKLREFDGKRFILNTINITSNGDFFISGQDFSMDAVGKVKGRVYKDLFLFHYDKTGNLKRYYGVENTAKSAGLTGGAGGAKSFPSEFAIYESPNQKDLFWNILLVKDIDVDCSTSEDATSKTTTCVYSPLYQGRFGKINIGSGEISEFKTFGGEDFYLYIDLEDNNKGKDSPWLTINNGKELVYIARQRKGGMKGNDRWGNSIWFGKFDPAAEK